MTTKTISENKVEEKYMIIFEEEIQRGFRS